MHDNSTSLNLDDLDRPASFDKLPFRDDIDQVIGKLTFARWT